MSSFNVPSGRHCVEIEVKKSRFICWVDYAQSRNDLKNLVAEAREKYPDARHHCWAFSAFNGREEGLNDDGEPKGTAGRPMLTVLQFAPVTNISAVVIRYFGGIKLGTGGLARAYGDAVKAALATLPTRPYVEYQSLKGEFDFADEHQLRYLAGQFDAQIDINYQSALSVEFSVMQTHYDDLKSALNNQFPSIEIKEDEMPNG